MPDPMPAIAIDYAAPERRRVDPVLRVMGGLNTAVGIIATLMATAHFIGPGSRRTASLPLGTVVWSLSTATVVLQLVAGVGLLRRTSWGLRATAGWAVASVAVQLFATVADVGWEFRLAPPGRVLWFIALYDLQRAVWPIAFAVLCGAVAVDRLGRPAAEPMSSSSDHALGGGPSWPVPPR